MKLARLLITCLFLILLVSHSISARLLPTNQGASLETKEDDDIFNLMGREECNNADEDCLERRMIAEAHLDYIYTQRHKPKP